MQQGRSKVQKGKSIHEQADSCSGSEGEGEDGGELGKHTRQSGEELREMDRYIY